MIIVTARTFCQYFSIIDMFTNDSNITVLSNDSIVVYIAIFVYVYVLINVSDFTKTNDVPTDKNFLY